VALPPTTAPRRPTGVPWLWIGAPRTEPHGRTSMPPYARHHGLVTRLFRDLLRSGFSRDVRIFMRITHSLCDSPCFPSVCSISCLLHCIGLFRSAHLNWGWVVKFRTKTGAPGAVTWSSPPCWVHREWFGITASDVTCLVTTNHEVFTQLSFTDAPSGSKKHRSKLKVHLSTVPRHPNRVNDSALVRISWYSTHGLRHDV